jgi:hypothetical protein
MTALSPQRTCQHRLHKRTGTQAMSEEAMPRAGQRDNGGTEEQAVVRGANGVVEGQLGGLGCKRQQGAVNNEDCSTETQDEQ